MLQKKSPPGTDCQGGILKTYLVTAEDKVQLHFYLLPLQPLLPGFFSGFASSFTVSFSVLTAPSLTSSVASVMPASSAESCLDCSAFSVLPALAFLALQPLAAPTGPGNTVWAPASRPVMLIPANTFFRYFFSM